MHILILFFYFVLIGERAPYQVPVNVAQAQHAHVSFHCLRDARAEGEIHLSHQ